jgi:hypothetical protein
MNGLVATRADHSFFATDKEAAMFHALAPESAHKVSALGNGVDSDYFAPASGCRTPFSQDEQTLVFTGAMDYWPNIDAVTWFAKEMFPRLRAHWPRLHFHIVGRSPTAAVRALAGDAVHVTGTVPDVRPYLQHADVVVAPLRLARGIQNKVLEAMAMARPVVAAAACVEAIDCAPGEHLVAAADAADYVREIDALLSDPQRASQVGAAGRAQVVAVYGWDARLQTLDAHLGTGLQGGDMTAAVLRLPPGAWVRLAPGLLLLVAQLVLFRDTALAMVGTWSRSDTFAHAFLVPPIVVWLIWRRRDELAQLTVKPAPWVLLAMAAACVLWLLGELANVNAASQLRAGQLVGPDRAGRVRTASCEGIDVSVAVLVLCGALWAISCCRP